ncbi:hypothetical protein [Actinocorallia populi]|uniref:hypothetical protein n=1 Tax=Actinocorallia populi TaxID=2079200 RepID=UPI000D0926A2|nr:hypothetical protein [Actinocorallia populi]
MTVDEDVTINGDGNQNVFGNEIGGDVILQQLNFVRHRASMVLSSDEIDERVEEYVPAFNHVQIVKALRNFHVLALAGPDGSGVKTAAIAALRELRPGLAIRLFATEKDDVEEIRISGVLGYLVRAADEDDTSRLRSCVEAVLSSGGYLVVMGTEAEQRRFADHLQMVLVEPPPAEAVYRRRLERRGLGSTRWYDWPRSRDLLDGSLPGHGRRLADLVWDAVQRGGDAYQVEQAYLGWGEELRGWFGQHGLLERILMIAATTIAPADEDSVYGAALTLAKRLDVPLEGGGLAWHPSAALDGLLDAEREDGDRIVFRRLGYAESVLRHVCTQHPLARLDLLSWLSELPTDPVVTLEPALRYRLVESFADLAADYNLPEKIVQRAEHWADGRRRTADLAYIVLARTCLHPRVGGRVRTRLYLWSKERTAPRSLKLTVIQVCEVLGQTHLSIALTRLKHLATYGDAEIRDKVFEVACSLARNNPPAVFRTALQWCRTAARMSDRANINRIEVGLRLLCTLLPQGGPAELRDVLGIIDFLAAQGDSRFRPLLLKNLLQLAAEYPWPVLDLLLSWTRGADDRSTRGITLQASLGAEVFLALAGKRNGSGPPVFLSGHAPVDLAGLTPAWSVAFGIASGPERRLPEFEEVLRLWLETAVARPALRPLVLSSLLDAAESTTGGGRLLLNLVTSWSNGRPEWRRVREAVYVRLLQPDWQRWLLILWVWFRSLFENRSRGRARRPS